MEPFRLRLFAGGHFYLDAARSALIEEIAAALASEPDAWRGAPEA